MALSAADGSVAGGVLAIGVALSREYTAPFEAAGAILENKRQYQHMHSAVLKYTTKYSQFFAIEFCTADRCNLSVSLCTRYIRFGSHQVYHNNSHNIADDDIVSPSHISHLFLLNIKNKQYSAVN
jgi:hypothetical protein